jgi:methylated-DNA-protein-cysteine methyltransferase-like protein
MGDARHRGVTAARMTELAEHIRAVVAALQPGEVVSYSEVARRAGAPGRARAVGAVLAEGGHGLPWWRVVRRDGTLAAPSASEQRRRLEAEAVDVVDGRVVGGVP